LIVYFQGQIPEFYMKLLTNKKFLSEYQLSLYLSIIFDFLELDRDLYWSNQFDLIPPGRKWNLLSTIEYTIFL